MRNYEITLWWSDEDQVFVAEVPELRGCMAHGITQEKALANVRDAMALWIETTTRAGDPVPEPKRRGVVEV